MKKEYHYTIARTDRICLVSFVVVLLAWELAKGFFPGGDKTYTHVPTEKKSYARNYDNDKKYKYSSKAYYKNKYPRKQYKSKFENYHLEKSSPPSHPVSIMAATINEMKGMGFSVKTAFNIQKYISSGGVISSEKDLLRIYGMDSTQLKLVSPYIIYAPPKENKFANSDAYKKKSSVAIIDLNTSTQEDLVSLNGIGEKLAERIIKFRESLGGFIEVDQLKDCYGISPELFTSLRPQLITSGNIQKININDDSLSLKFHPYLNKKMVKLISAYIDQHGPILNADELRKVYPSDSLWFRKVMPYLNFDDR